MLLFIHIFDKKIVFVVFGIVMVALIIGFVYQRKTPQVVLKPTPNDISILKNSFEPSILNVKVGDTVSWVNNEVYGHDIISDSDLFKSSKLANGEKFSYTFTKEGTYAYHCGIHPFMKGSIIVTSEIPSEISMLFGKLNSGLSSNFVPTENIDGDKKSWTIDFTSAVREKAQIVIVRNLLEQELTLDITKSAAGAGQTIDAYNNETIECYLLLGIGKKDVLTCANR